MNANFELIHVKVPGLIMRTRGKFFGYHRMNTIEEIRSIDLDVYKVKAGLLINLSNGAGPAESKFYKTKLGDILLRYNDGGFTGFDDLLFTRSERVEREESELVAEQMREGASTGCRFRVPPLPASGIQSCRIRVGIHRIKRETYFFSIC